MDPSHSKGSQEGWLKMQYCITKEEVDWIIKDWPAQWQSPVEKPTTRTGTTQSSKPKDKAEAGSSTQNR
jgi:hypothetical protein